MIPRPKISRNEWKPTEIGAFEVGIFAPFSCPEGDVAEREGVLEARAHAPGPRAGDGEVPWGVPDEEGRELPADVPGRRGVAWAGKG